MLNSLSEAVVVTKQGLAIKTRSANIRKVPESERWDADSIHQMRVTPCSPDGSENAFDIQVGMERSAEMVPRDPGEVLMENKVARTYLRRADFEQCGLSEGCSGCWYLPGRPASVGSWNNVESSVIQLLWSRQTGPTLSKHAGKGSKAF